MLSRFTLLFVLFFLAVLSCNNSQISEDPALFSMEEDDGIRCDSATAKAKSDWIDGIFTKLSKGYWFNGSVAYLEKGCLIYKKSFGLANFQTKDSLNDHSAFQLASVSKMFAATAAMILHEKGKLDYDADIREYLPDFPYEGITTRLLLTHRSGLPRYMSLAHDKWMNKEIPMTNDDMLRLFDQYVPAPYFTPNNGFHYCNANYALIACIVESISGMPFADYVQKKIFEPLGMNDSFVFHMSGDSIVSDYIDTKVQGHNYRGYRPIRARNEYLNGVTGDKGVYTSINDLIKFDRAITKNTLLEEESMREAFTPGSPKYWKRKDNYGFGWRIKEDEDSTAYHFGWWKGFRAYYIRDNANSKTLIVLTNKEKGPSSSVYWDIVHDTAHVVRFEE